MLCGIAHITVYNSARMMRPVFIGLLRMEQKIAADLATSTQSLTDTSMLPAFMNWKVGLKEQEEILGSMVGYHPVLIYVQGLC